MNTQDKVEFIHAVFPQISEPGQNYLRSVAETLNLIQSPATPPFFANYGESKTLFPVAAEEKDL